MKMLCLAAAALVGLGAWAQEGNSESNVTVKIYNESATQDIYRIVRPDSVSFSSFSVVEVRRTLFRPTVAIQWGGNGQGAHEIELNRLYFGKSDSDFDPTSLAPAGSSVSSFELAFRYEYTFAAREFENEKWMLAASVGAMPFYEWRNSGFSDSEAFPINEQRVGTQINLTTRILYNVTDKLMIDFNFPIAVADAQYYHQVLDDPSLFNGAEGTSAGQFELFPKYMALRVGVGYRL